MVHIIVFVLAVKTKWADDRLFFSSHSPWGVELDEVVGRLNLLVEIILGQDYGIDFLFFILRPGIGDDEGE